MKDLTEDDCISANTIPSMTTAKNRTNVGGVLLNWRIVLLAFTTLFLAELGDKTQLAVFTLVTETRSPWAVFLGASLALVAVTLIGALFGGWVTRHVPARYLKIAAGLLFVGIGSFVICQAFAELVHKS
jgi:putative Ca2+/H+ antiporter (TMEM165/GDT1 family)